MYVINKKCDLKIFQTDSKNYYINKIFDILSLKLLIFTWILNPFIVYNNS